MSEHVLLSYDVAQPLMTYVVAPCRADEIDRADRVQIMRFRKTNSAVLVNIRSNTPGEGRGTMLLQAAVAWGMSNGLKSLTGKMITNTSDLTRDWYRRRGVEVDPWNILSADLSEVWGICATIMAQRGCSYRIETMTSTALE